MCYFSLYYIGQQPQHLRNIPKCFQSMFTFKRYHGHLKFAKKRYYAYLGYNESRRICIRSFVCEKRSVELVVLRFFSSRAFQNFKRLPTLSLDASVASLMLDSESACAFHYYYAVRHDTRKQLLI